MVVRTRVYSVQQLLIPERPQLRDVSHHTNVKWSRYQTDGEGMTVFDRSRCDKGAGWLKTDEMRSEFRKVCKRLDEAKDEALGANMRSHVQNIICICCGSTVSL